MKSFRRLTGPFSLSGKGLHSGVGCICTVEPSDEDLALSTDGINFFPIKDLNLAGTGRGSDYIFPCPSGFNNGERRIRTCEHVLSALAGLGVWRAKVTVEGPEMPGLDGCAEFAVSKVLENSEPCTDGPEPLELPFALKVGDEKRFVAAFPAPDFHITYIVQYDSPLIGTHIYEYKGASGLFASDISRARTFAMASDLAELRKHGMALGGSLDNAILVGDTELQAAGGLRYPDEFVRHKVLDLIGDLAAVGRPVSAHIVAVRAGHELHLRLAEKLRFLK